MELRHLRYFAMVAQELHFGRAAERLHISQPPLSQQIRELEEEIGVRLFHRTKRHVELTEAGKFFFAEVQRLFAHLNTAVRGAQRAERGESGRLVIGFVMSATCSVLPDILHDFRERFPEVELVLEEATTGTGLEAVREGRQDVCFVRLPLQDEGGELLHEPVLKEKVILVLPQKHPLATKTNLTLKMLAGDSFILFPRSAGSNFYDQIVSLCHQAGFSPKVAQEATQMQTILGLVAGGLGIALIPASVQTLRSQGVVYKNLREQMPETGLAMAWRRDNRSATLQNFMRVVREVARR